MLSELGRLTAQMRAASGARAERQLADGRALEAHQRHVREKIMSQTSDFHWLIINLLWQLICEASGFGFLPSSYSLLPLSRDLHALVLPLPSAVLFVVWFVRLEIDLRELCVLLSTCIWGALVWLFDRGYQRTHEGANCTDRALHLRTACGPTVHLDLLHVYSKVYGYPRTNGRGLVSPVPVPTCTCKGRGVSATEYIDTC